MSLIYNPTNFGVYLLATNTITPQPISLMAPGMQNGQFNFSFLSAAGASYALQHNDNLATTNWVTDTNFIGDGSLVPVSLPVGSQPARFYRLGQN